MTISNREALVLEIIEKTGLSSVSIMHAFTQTPREQFVPSFLEKQGGQWVTVSQKNDDEYLQKVYTDTSLVVQVDHRGWACSSSSMPSIMAVMLEALDVPRASKVLEIGTGTGYNAALLSILTGDASLVTSIDCENARALSDAARHALHALVGPVHVINGDGFQGVLQNAPYDRIIATASAPMIPSAWIDQLAPGGILVMDLHGPLESGFLVFEKNKNDHGGHGHFLKRSLHFMPLVSEHVSTIFVDPKFLLLRQQPHQQQMHVEEHMVAMLLKDHAFRWFLQWYIPSCKIVEFSEEHKVFIVVSHQQSIVQLSKTADGWIADAFGSDTFLNNVFSAYEQWIELGQPPVEDYHVLLSEMGEPMFQIKDCMYSMLAL